MFYDHFLGDGDEAGDDHVDADAGGEGVGEYGTHDREHDDHHVALHLLGGDLFGGGVGSRLAGTVEGEFYRVVLGRADEQGKDEIVTRGYVQEAEEMRADDAGGADERIEEFAVDGRRGETEEDVRKADKYDELDDGREDERERLDAMFQE